MRPKDSGRGGRAADPNSKAAVGVVGVAAGGQVAREVSLPRSGVQRCYLSPRRGFTHFTPHAAARLQGSTCMHAQMAGSPCGACSGVDSDRPRRWPSWRTPAKVSIQGGSLTAPVTHQLRHCLPQLNTHGRSDQIRWSWCNASQTTARIEFTSRLQDVNRRL